MQDNTQSTLDQAHSLRVVHTLDIISTVALTLVMLVPIINYLVGLKLISEIFARAILSKQFLTLLVALAVSIPAGLLVSWCVVAVFSGRSDGVGAIALYSFVVGPAAAALAGLLVTGRERSE